MAQIQYTPYVTQNTFKLPQIEETDIPIIRGKKKEKEEIVLAPLPVTPPSLPSPTESIVKGIIYNPKGYNVGSMQPHLDALRDAGISFRITSGIRPGAVTKQGNESHHAKGNAADIVVVDENGKVNGDYAKNIIKTNKDLQNYLLSHNIGILEETTPDVMARTGATGAHWHIGPDRVAMENLRRIIYSKKGTKLQRGNVIEYTPYTFHPNENREIRFVQEPPRPYQSKYNLSINPFANSEAFDRGYQYYSQVTGNDPNPDAQEHHYDYRGYFGEVAYKQPYEVLTADTHLPDTYKLPGHETFSVESKYYKPGMMAGHGKGDNFMPTPFGAEEMEARQQYAETRFKKGRVSPAGARGAYQFMPGTWRSIQQRFGLHGDIENYNDNKQARDLYMDSLIHNDLIRFASEPSKIALAYAAYNGGIGNLKKFIEKEQNKGIDVYNTGDWIDDLPSEPRNYVNFIVRGIDGKGDLTNSAFNKALPNRYNEFPEVNNN